MPVLPLVASRIVLPRVSAPVFSPSRTIQSAGQSLTEPPGLNHSALPRSRTDARGDRRERSRSGVLPTRATRSSARVAGFIVHLGCPDRRPLGPENETPRSQGTSGAGGTRRSTVFDLTIQYDPRRAASIL